MYKVAPSFEVAWPLPLADTWTKTRYELAHSFWSPDPCPEWCKWAHHFDTAWHNWRVLEAWKRQVAYETDADGQDFVVWNATGGDLREKRHLVGRVPMTIMPEGWARNTAEMVLEIDALIDEYEGLAPRRSHVEALLVEHSKRMFGST